jgi:hypothetical protein
VLFCANTIFHAVLYSTSAAAAHKVHCGGSVHYRVPCCACCSDIDIVQLFFSRKKQTQAGRNLLCRAVLWGVVSGCTQGALWWSAFGVLFDACMFWVHLCCVMLCCAVLFCAALFILGRVVVKR